VFAADLADIRCLREKLELQRQRMLLEVQDFIESIPGEELEKMALGELSAEVVARGLNEAVAPGITIDDEVPECGTAIFEGAQGVLLDEYRGFHPHTTWNTVTAHHAWELIHQMSAEAVAVLGITRTYLTRHGEGPLPSFSSDLTTRLADPGNPWNRWQGTLRCGWLDLPLLRYAAKAVGRLDGLVVNHFDQVCDGPLFMCEEYRNATVSHSVAPNLAFQARLTDQLQQADAVLTPVDAENILERLSEIAPVVLTGSGPSHRERSCTDLVFRRRRSGNLGEARSINRVGGRQPCRSSS
jgi:adenylosuccinate synthase